MPKKSETNSSVKASKKNTSAKSTRGSGKTKNSTVDKTKKKVSKSLPSKVSRSSSNKKISDAKKNTKKSGPEKKGTGVSSSNKTDSKVNQDSKKRSYKRRKLKFNRFMKKYKKQVITILLIAVILGSLHGLYMSYTRERRHHQYVGSMLCNGEILEGEIYTDPGDRSILIFYQMIISQGTVNTRLYDPDGELVAEFNDWEDVLRQKLIDLKEHKPGRWKFIVSCDKAEIDYRVMFDVKDERSWKEEMAS